MDRATRAEIKREYKQAAHPRGVFAITCTVTSRVWVDTAPNLDTIQNRIWFTLRLGSHHNAALQREWNEAGPDAFRFEAVEIFDGDVAGYALDTLTKDRKAHWMDALGADSCQ